MAIPAGGAQQYPEGALDDFVEVRSPASLATSRMTRGAFEYFWKGQDFTVVRTVGVVVRPDGGS